MNRIIISVTNDLVTDQRVLRTCECLNELGFEILLIGRKFKNSLEFKAPFDHFRFHLIFNKGFLFYAEYNLRLFFKLLPMKKKVLYANDLDTLLPNFLISKLSSCKLVYDSHEYFTEVPELISRPLTRSFWSVLEGLIFPKLKNVITVNHEIASIYYSKYKIPLTVIRNVPKRLEISNAKNVLSLEGDQKIILYQGALNKGRGLELMIDAIPYLKNYVLVLAGDGDLWEQLKMRTASKNLEKKVIFLGKITPEKLVHVTKQADLGLSLEEDMGMNYRYCLPNKVFDYIQAGVPVLVSDLPLLKELIRDFKIGEVLIERDPESLALAIVSAVANKKDYEEGLKLAAKEFNWEKEKKILVEFIKNIE